MPTSTPNLSLYKYDTSTDGDMTFNFTNSLNNNWDKIDTYCKNLSDNKADTSTVNSALALKADTSSVNAALALKADTALDNLSSAGDARLHALKSYSDNGELLTDAEGLAYVKNYAHSTFDRSKFPVVGSPNITNNGIASGFSGSNYLNKTIDISSANTWEIIVPVKVTGTQTSEVGIWGIRYNSDTPTRLSYNATSSVLLLYLSTTGGAKNISVPAFTFTINTEYLLKSEFTGTEYKLSYSTDNGITWNALGAVTSSDKITGCDDIRIGITYTSAPLANANMDLKQVCIKAGGVPIFSGNKTGIDTIKDDDYTTTGTPTISSDGVATFSGSSSVDKSLNLSGDTVKVVIPFNTSDLAAKNLLASTSGYVTCDIMTTGGKYLPRFRFSDGVNSHYIRTGTNGLVADTDYIVVGEYNKNTNYATITLYSASGSVIETVTNQPSNTITIPNSSQAYNLGSNATNLKIDLNGVKFYVTGDLLYQPCLKIPYNISKTGSKVVYSVYRGRVNDMAKQFGYANYHTLSDIDFTLPQVELYGIIGNCLDTKYPKQIEKDTIIDWMMPDWSRVVTQIITPIDGETGAVTSGPYNYTATKKGWVQAYGTTPQVWVGLYVNGVIVAGTQAAGANDNTGYAGCVPVNVGDIYYATSAYGGALNFLPCKGEV